MLLAGDRDESIDIIIIRLIDLGYDPIEPCKYFAGCSGYAVSKPRQITLINLCFQFVSYIRNERTKETLI